MVPQWKLFALMSTYMYRRTPTGYYVTCSVCNDILKLILSWSLDRHYLILKKREKTKTDKITSECIRFFQNKISSRLTVTLFIFSLSSWLEDMEKQIQLLAMPALRPEQIVQQQDKNEVSGVDYLFADRLLFIVHKKKVSSCSSLLFFYLYIFLFFSIFFFSFISILCYPLVPFDHDWYNV